jgi:hypothetical protein
MQEKTPFEWFEEAERAYWEQHQGCAWCGGSYRVHANLRGTRQTFHCQRCDFQVSYDQPSDRWQLVPGEKVPVGMDTMLEQPIANLL